MLGKTSSLKKCPGIRTDSSDKWQSHHSWKHSKLSRHSFPQFGLVGTVVLSQRFDKMILQVFSNLNDSMIL